MRFRLSPCLLLLAFAPASQLRAADTTPADALKPFVEKNSLAGAVVLVASPDKVLSLEAVGFADRANKTAMHTDNMFWIASMSKPITAAGLMVRTRRGEEN